MNTNLESESRGQFAEIDQVLDTIQAQGRADQRAVDKVMSLLGDPVMKNEYMARISQKLADHYLPKDNAVEHLHLSDEIIKANQEVSLNADETLKSEKKILGNQSYMGQTLTLVRQIRHIHSISGTDEIFIDYRANSNNKSRSTSLFQWTQLEGAAPQNFHREIDDELQGGGMSSELLALGENFLKTIGKSQATLKTAKAGSALWAIAHGYRIKESDITPAVMTSLLSWKGSYSSTEEDSLISKELILEKQLI